MCWSAGVSAAFAICHLATAAIVVKHCRWRSHTGAVFIRFCWFYALMELLQMLQWLTLSYRAVNTLLTIGAYALIWLQPVLLTVFVDPGEYPSVRVVLQFMAWLTATMAMASLTLATATGHRFAGVDALSESTNYGPQTTTCPGQQFGHLAWHFNVWSLEYTPNYAMYLVLIVTAFRFYGDALKRTVALGWTLTLVAAVVRVGTSLELPAYWCLLSVFVDPLIVWHVLKKRQ